MKFTKFMIRLLFVFAVISLYKAFDAPDDSMEYYFYQLSTLIISIGSIILGSMLDMWKWLDARTTKTN